MAASSTPWHPQEQGIQEICNLLQLQISPSSTGKSQVWQQLQHYSQFSDFNNYLVFIVARGEGKSAEIRQAAGLLLKNNLINMYGFIPPSHQLYIKSEVLPGLGAADKHVRSTIGTIISVIVQQEGIPKWPDLLQTLLTYLNSNVFDLMEGALDAVYKICEDAPHVLDAEVLGSSDRPIDLLLSHLLKFFHSSHPNLKKLALGSVNFFILSMPPALYASMNQYLQGLFFLANDPASEVRKLVCSAFLKLAEHQPNFLEPTIRDVIEYMLLVNKDSDDEVTLEACEFWSTYCDSELPIGTLKEFLPRLIPILFSNMVYAEDDESLIDVQEDGSLPDREQDMEPRFHSSRFHGSECVDDDDDDIVNTWNLRKCSAAALDHLSNAFGDEILPTLMPLVQAKLTISGGEAWKEREAAVLAIGAVAEGCISGLYPHLSQIVGFLVPLLDDEFPLVRSISCWTLSRFSKYIVQESIHEKSNERFDKILMGFLRRMLDNNKRVQEAACSAFATFEEIAGEKLVPMLDVILQHLMCAFGKYQRRNLRIVYDAIGTLSDAVGLELNQPIYLEMLMPPLISKWQRLSNSDKDLLPLLECLTSLTLALRTGFAQFAEPIFQRCMSIIQMQRSEKAGSVATENSPDKEFVVCSLDLLSGLAEGLGSGIESLVSKSDLRDLLLGCCMDDANEVRQSAFALLGDLAKVCCVHLHPRVSEFLNVASKQLRIPEIQETTSVANNACWAIGELAVKVHQEVCPVVMNVMPCLVQILDHRDEMSKSLIENSAITLGRLAWACPELVAPHVEHFMQSWCSSLTLIHDDIEKEDAFWGLCAMVRANPSGALNSLVFMCKAIASWNEIRNEELHNEVCMVFHGYKQMLGNGALEQYMSALHPSEREKLSRYVV